MSSDEEVQDSLTIIDQIETFDIVQVDAINLIEKDHSSLSKNDNMDERNEAEERMFELLIDLNEYSSEKVIEVFDKVNMIKLLEFFYPELNS